MSSFPPAARPAPPGYEPEKPVPVWMVLIAVAVVLAVGGVGVTALVQKDGGSGKTYPKTWDARIQPYVKIAEKKRGLDFLHPVEVRFLPVAKFKKTVTTDEKELDKDDKEEIEQFTGLMRALGLLSGDVDMFKESNDLSGGGTLAYYAFEDERITIRGQRVTPSMRSTLVHELTHVLQDQHFKIGARMERMAEQEEKDAPSTSEYSLLRGILEGDAERVEHLYERSLPPRQRKALAKSEGDETAEAEEDIKDVPSVMVALMAAPYALGEGLVQVVAADGGNDAVDDLFRDTPAHETALIDPLRVLSGDVDAADLDVPDLEKGEKSMDSSGEFGTLSWYLMLAERLPMKEALATADGWGGDAYTAFTRDGTSCMRAVYEGESPGDTSRMFTSLQQWMAAAPGSSTSATKDGDQVTFESCDPGKDAKGVGKEASLEALRLLSIRTSLGLGMLREGVPDTVARCLAGRLVQEYSATNLSDPEFGADDERVRARVGQLAMGCR